MRKESGQKGMSLIEVVLVLVLISISLGTSFIYYRSSILKADVNTQAEILVSKMRLIQGNAVAQLDGASHGVHFETSSYTVFSGDTYSASEPENETTDFPETMTIQNISINGGGSDVIFEGPYGDTNNYGTIDLVANEINKTITIEISSIGTVNY